MASSIMQSRKRCYLTGAETGLDCHHIYAGARRKKADQWGCWVWLRHDIHMRLHSRDQALAYRLKQECQAEFELRYGHEKFMEVFGKNYL